MTIKTCVLLLGAALILTAQAEELAVVTRSFTPDALQLMQSEDEDVDLFTGGLFLRYEDVRIPGPAGLDIVVERVYSSNSVRSATTSMSVSPNYAYEASGLGVGWSLMAAPRIVANEPKRCTSYGGSYGNSCTYARPTAVERLCTGGNPGSYDSAYAMYVHLPDGKQMQLYGKGAGVAESKEGWRVTCSNWTVNLREPNGTTYTLQNAQLNPDGSPKTPLPPSKYRTGWNPTNYTSYTVLVAVKKQDVNGNWIAYKYATPNDLALRRIDASDGRWVEFEYSDQLGFGFPQLQAIRTKSGATWVYRPLAFPSSAWFGTAASWQKFYALQTVTLPTGQQLSYDYHSDPYAWKSGNFAAVSRLKSRTELYGGATSYDYAYAGYPYTYGGPNSSVTSEAQSFRVSKVTRGGDVTSYTYTKGGIGQYDTTVVRDGLGDRIYRFFGSGFNWNGFSPAYTNTTWKVGLLAEKSIVGVHAEKYEYVPREVSPYPIHIGPGVEPQKDAKVWVAMASKVTIVRDGQAYVTWRQNFDAYGNPGTVVESGPNGGTRKTTITYHNDALKWIIGKIKDETFAGGSVSRAFDANGRLTAKSIDGVLTTYSYDAQGNLYSKSLPRGLKHIYTNYKFGIARREDQPEGITILREVDDAGNIVAETNGVGATTRWTYDGLRRPTSRVPHVGNPISIIYTGNRTTVTRGDLVEDKQWDGYGRLKSIILGRVIRMFNYDARGRKVFESNPGSLIGTNYIYDNLGRVVQATNPDGTRRLISYAAAQRIVTDERGKSTVYKYRGYGNPEDLHLVGVQAAVPSASITIGLNSRDLISSVTQNGLTRTHGYNSNYYLLTVDDPETGRTTFGRDAAGNMTSRTVGASGTTVFGYDGQNRLTRTTYPDGVTITNTYDRAGKLVSASSLTGTRTLSYDYNGNLLGETVTVDGVARGLAYTYNRNDQLSAIRYPSGFVVNYAPDVLGRPSSVTGVATSVAYWPSGQVRQINYANGVTSSYDQSTRLWPSSFISRSASTVYTASIYRYDGVGNLTAIADSVDASAARSMVYDDINRLTAFSIPGVSGTATMTYDGAGNIRSQSIGTFQLTYGYDAANRVSALSGSINTTFFYDAYANIVSGGGQTYAYDGVPNLRCVACSNPSARVDYTYDGTNRRASFTKAGIETYEVYDSRDQLMGQYSRGKFIEYIYLGGKRIAQRAAP